MHYSYKGHTKSDIDLQPIHEFDLSTASLHDSQADPSEDGDTAIYRELKGYAGVPLGAKGVSDLTIEKTYQNRPLKERQKLRNKTIAGIRSIGERPHAAIKRVFKNRRTCLKHFIK